VVQRLFWALDPRPKAKSTRSPDTSSCSEELHMHERLLLIPSMRHDGVRQNAASRGTHDIHRLFMLFTRWLIMSDLACTRGRTFVREDGRRDIQPSFCQASTCLLSCWVLTIQWYITAHIDHSTSCI
jgi:hypothetical protein